ncbi:TerB family tellurite resistance protein [Sulfurimonas sp. SAG-AH-194-I05]|nr:TerB family tellurite resistance protein [Sulfurimonas sp. SAG-AH-194-I05]MDF1875214.1 TerB family tellurite resistance protein [Sulfurimonas sp. SAG-AH-194-I05]
MSRFKKAIKKKELETALSKHPLRELSEDVKSDYVKGLVFLATEDENFNEDEKSYITSLMSNIGLDASLLAEFETFASECEEEELLAFMDRLKAFDEDIKVNFLIEVIVVSFKDGEFDESEQAMFDDYLEMLEVADKKDDIMYISLALVNKDIDLALAMYTAKKDFFNKYDYMFDMIGVDVEKELNDVFSWEWIEFRLDKCVVENSNLVASKPITTRQACIFLNSNIIANSIFQVPNTTKFEFQDAIFIIDINNSNLDYCDDLFNYDEDIKNNSYLGSSIFMPSSFSSWIKIVINISVQILYIKIDDFSLVLSESARGFLTDDKELFKVNIPYASANDTFRYFNVMQTDYDAYGKLEDDRYAFRLMKIVED